jgi:hypothetical protein
MGANFAQNNPNALNFLKGGLTGASQGLSQYGSQNPQFNFSQLQQGFQQARKPALGQGVTPNAANYTRVQNMNPFSANPWGGNYT